MKATCAIYARNGARAANPSCRGAVTRVRSAGIVADHMAPGTTSERLKVVAWRFSSAREGGRERSKALLQRTSAEKTANCRNILQISPFTQTHLFRHNSYSVTS